MIRGGTSGGSGGGSTHFSQGGKVLQLSSRILQSIQQFLQANFFGSLLQLGFHPHFFSRERLQADLAKQRLSSLQNSV